MQKQSTAFYGGLGPLVAVLALVAVAASAPPIAAAQAPSGRTEGPFTEVSAGDSHTCGVKADGTIACWGRNDRGQAPPSRADGPYAHVAAGLVHTCGLKQDGSVAC